MFGRCTKIFLFSMLAVLAIEGLALKLSKADKSNRIYGGESNTIDKTPYLVQLRESDTGDSYCGGTLVDSTHVVTAAHCLHGIDPVKDLVVVGGASTKGETGVQRKIVASYKHPKYGRGGHSINNDITVLKLESPMEGKDIKPIGLSFDGVEDGKFLLVSGWGVTENGALGLNDLARSVRVEIVGNDVCNKKYGTKGVNSSMICATSPGKDSCSEDSGGPAIYQGKLVGVVSWGKDCASPDYPGVYTSIKSSKDFLLQCLSK